MPQLNRLFGAGRHLRFTVILSLMLLITVGGSLWLTAWSARARAEERTKVAAATTGRRAVMDSTPVPGAETGVAAATDADDERTREAGFSVTWERTFIPPDGQQSRRLATTTRYQRADGTFKLVHTFDAAGGDTPGGSGGKVYFGLKGLGYFRLDEANRVLVFTTPVSADDEAEDAEAFLRAQPQFDREEDVRGQDTIVWRMADQEEGWGFTEEWRAPALGGLILKRVVTSKRGQDVFTPTEITLGAPPAELFAELSGYPVDYSHFEAKIIEMEREGNKETAQAMRRGMHRMRAARPAGAR
jgi:hypothetical protein